MDGDLVPSHPTGCLGDDHPGTILEGIRADMSVPQSLLLLSSKLAQVHGYCLGLQDGVRGSGLRKDHPEIVEPFENGLAHLNGLIEEACSIEQELRAKLRKRGEEV